MNKQDGQGVRSLTDIERKYDLGAIAGLKKAAQMSEAGIQKTNQTLEQFANATVKNFLQMQEQMDGELDGIREEVDRKIENWFFNGAPTLSNKPASEWDVESYESHVGDMYYDRDTGYVYRFKVEDGVFSWERVQDKDTVEALAKANAAGDTADRKRQVFLETPVPPYDNGDLWIREREIYVCQISKPEGEEYAEEDFILATNYTDDTYARQVGDTLEILSGTVTKIIENADSLKIQFDTTIQSIQKNEDGIQNALKEAGEEMAAQKETLEQLKQMSYQFGTESLTIESSNSANSTSISNDGMKVYKKVGDQKEEMLKADHEGVKAVDLHAKTYLIVGNNSRFEDMGDGRTACFWIGK